MHSGIYGGAPSRITQLFTVKRNVHGHDTRQANVFVDQRNLSLTTGSFIHQGTLSWLALSNELKTLSNCHLFKKRVYQMLLNQN